MKKAYLTIDDSPSKDFSEKIDYLHKHKIPAIIFCRGDLLEKNSTAAIRAIKKGYDLQNHSYSHPKFSKVSTKEAKEEIRKTEKIIENLYKIAGKKRSIKAFRFPYGNKGDGYLKYIGLRKKKRRDLQQVLFAENFKQLKFKGVTYPSFIKLAKELDIYWTYDFKEYKLRTAEKAIKRWRQSDNIQSDSVEVLLIHDHLDTKATFFKIIDELITEKISFKKL